MGKKVTLGIHAVKNSAQLPYGLTSAKTLQPLPVGMEPIRPPSDNDKGVSRSPVAAGPENPRSLQLPKPKGGSACFMSGCERDFVYWPCKRAPVSLPNSHLHWNTESPLICTGVLAGEPSEGLRSHASQGNLCR